MENDYNKEAKNLCLAVDIAIESYKKHTPAGINKEQLELMLMFLEETKEQALSPEPEFQKISSLDYLVQDFLREFQEGTGALVDHFWKTIKENNLPFQQSNRLIQILQSKKIKSYSEYSYVTESIVTGLKTGQITHEQADELKVFVTNYQKFHSKQIDQ